MDSVLFVRYYDFDDKLVHLLGEGDLDPSIDVIYWCKKEFGPPLLEVGGWEYTIDRLTGFAVAEDGSGLGAIKSEGWAVWIRLTPKHKSAFYAKWVVSDEKVTTMKMLKHLGRPTKKAAKPPVAR